jgi:hypothetical protein
MIARAGIEEEKGSVDALPLRGATTRTEELEVSTHLDVADGKVCWVIALPRLIASCAP